MANWPYRWGAVGLGVLITVNAWAFKPSHPKYDVSEDALGRLLEQRCKPKPSAAHRLPCQFLENFRRANSAFFREPGFRRNFVGPTFSVKDSQSSVQPSVTLEFIASRENSEEGVTELNLILKRVDPSRPGEKAIIDEAIREFSHGKFPKENAAVKFALTFEPKSGSLEYVRIDRKSLVLSRDQRRILFRALGEKIYALDLPAEDHLILKRGWSISELWAA